MIPRLLVSSLFAAACALAQQPQLTALFNPTAPTSYVPGGTIDFGTVSTGTSEKVTLQLTNTGGQDAKLTKLSADGSTFQLVWAGGNPVGLTIPAGKTLDFTITFAPLTTGPATLGQLWVQVAVPASSPAPVLQPLAEYDLTGTGSGSTAGPTPTPTPTPGPTPKPTPAPTPQPTPAPSWPAATVSIAPALASATQSLLSIRFDSPLPANGNGLLTMGFTGKGDNLRGFLTATGTNLQPEVSFTLTEGETAAEFDAIQSVIFLTGTTAYTVTFTATLGDGTQIASQQFTIAPAVVGFSLAFWEPSVNAVLVTVVGFDNTRTASLMSFTFYDTSGRQIMQPISVDGTQAFQSYFAANAATGAFSMTQAFNVTGAVSDIGTVAVSVTNSQGASPAETARMSQ